MNKMKALINTQKSKKTLLTVMIIVLVSTVSFGQGILVEGAGQLLKSLLAKKQQTSIFVLAKGYEETRVDINMPVLYDLAERMNGFAVTADFEESKDFAPVVLKSIEVNDVYVSFENNLDTENWMTESFADQMEAEIATESWMKESFSNQMEADVVAESWMTESFAGQMEAEIEVESWMTSPLAESLEPKLETENWMLDDFSKNIEAPVEVENWMTTPFEAGNSENELTVEDWMVEPFHKDLEDQIQNEDWIVSHK